MDAQVAYFYAALSQLDTMVSLIEVKEFRRGVGGRRGRRCAHIALGVFLCFRIAHGVGFCVPEMS